MPRRCSPRFALPERGQVEEAAHPGERLHRCGRHVVEFGRRVAEPLGELKGQDGKDLRVIGSGELVQTLMGTIRWTSTR